MSEHLKRLAAPRRWTIPQKEETWAMKPSGGSHPADVSVPLGILLRDYLEVADTASEARNAVSAGRVHVDGTRARDVNRSVGFMDVVSFPEAGDHYRVLLDQRGRVLLVPISEDQAAWKLARVEDKTTISGGRQQLNLHDGRNVVVDPEDDDYSTGDAIKLGLPDQEVQGRFDFEPDHVAMITGGAHAGELATLDEIEVTRNPSGNLAHLTKGEAEISTVTEYVFVVGDDDPAVTVPEVTIA